MTNRTVEPSVPSYGQEVSDTREGDGYGSIRTASMVAGVSLLVMAVLAGVTQFVVLERLVTQGDAAQTARDVVGSAGMFRLGLASLFLVIVLDVVVSWALFRVFPRSTRPSRCLLRGSGWRTRQCSWWPSAS